MATKQGEGIIFERFTDRARRVIVLAQEEARALKHNYIGTEHVLLGLLEEDGGVASRALIQLGITPTAVRARVKKIIGEGKEVAHGHIPFTPRAKKVQELALREALQLGHNWIGTEHILLGLIREGEGVAAQVLVELGAELSRVRKKVIEILGAPQDVDDSRPNPETLGDVASPVIDAIIGLVGEIPSFVSSTVDQLLSGKSSPELEVLMKVANRFIKQVTAESSAPAAPPPPPEAPAAPVTTDELLDAAHGLYSWVKGESCPDPEKYAAIAKRMWREAT